MRFDFNEANILNQNLFSSQDTKKTVLARLNDVYSNTPDFILKASVSSLIEKIERLSDEEVKLILYDILKKKFIITSNYKVISK